MNYKYFITIFALIFFAFPAISHAAVSDVSGFAWSENIGWISFSSENDHDPDTPGVQTSSIAYGVAIDDVAGVFSGYSWSSSIGWITFNPAGPYPENPQNSATLDLVANTVSGWARACAGSENPETTCDGGTNPDSGGWDGWMKMTGDIVGGGTYGVIYNPTTDEFSGWAWGGDVVGWVSFNCSNEGVCGVSDYQVVTDINQPPSAVSLATDGNYSGAENFCFSPPNNTFTWSFTDSPGETQGAYQLQVDDSSTFASMPEEGGTPDPWDIDTGKVVSGASSRTTNIVVSGALSPITIGYNRAYYWRLKVWDEEKDSGWILPDGAESPFDTAPHVYPDSLFTFFPQNPSEEEEITFTQTSECYDINNVKGPCPAVDGNYAWDFDYETPPFTQDAVGQSVTHTYPDADFHTIALYTTDAEGQTCRVESALTPQAPLPKFKEIAPTSFFDTVKNFLASLVG